MPDRSAAICLVLFSPWDTKARGSIRGKVAGEALHLEKGV